MFDQEIVKNVLGRKTPKGFFAVMVDGPLVGETRLFSEALPRWEVPLPARVTICDCDPEISTSFNECVAGVFTYYRIALGEGVALYSKHNNSRDAIVKSLKEWVVTDLSEVDRLHYSCRDRRGYE